MIGISYATLIAYSIGLTYYPIRGYFIFKTEIHILAVAVGIYLPIELSFPILIGGMVASKIKTKERGILLASGIITGEALMGILIALPIFISGNKSWWPKGVPSELVSLILFAIFICWFYQGAKNSKKLSNI